MRMNNELIILAGPTAIGKTAAGIELAKALGTEIISADSRQMYKEMSVGTAVPSEEERKGIPHHFIQNLSIHDDYNASRYENDVILLLDRLFARYPKVLMVGGSGLYIDAVRFGIDDLPVMDPELREHLKLRFREEGIESMRRELKQLDPVSYSRIDLKNPKRIQKAIEISLLTGKPYSEHLTRPRKPRNFRIRLLALNMERNELYRRINSRVISMIQNGLEEEARRLFPLRHLNALNTVGYKEMFDYFNGRMSRSEAIVKIQDNTRKYARKQLTWFRKDPEYTWFHPDDLKKTEKFIHE
jgi:tRNA dimethylallyltransferase